MIKNKNIICPLFVITFTLMLSACVQKNPYTKSSFKDTTYSIDQFNYQEDKVDVGEVYSFTISNSDRTYIKKCWLYVENSNRITVFKIYPKASVTYLVSSEIDWNTFSIQSIKQVEINKDFSKKESIEMHLMDTPANHYLMNNKDEIPTGHFPVFNHGYDFSDLNFIFRHRINPKSNVEVGILAPVGREFAYTGKMKITYIGEEVYNDKQCYRYSLSGTGISDKEGFLLANKDSGHFEYMELDANYHPLFDIFRYELLSITKMTKQEWDEFVIDESEKYFKKD